MNKIAFAEIVMSAVDAYASQVSINCNTTHDILDERLSIIFHEALEKGTRVEDVVLIAETCLIDFLLRSDETQKMSGKSTAAPV